MTTANREQNLQVKSKSFSSGGTLNDNDNIFGNTVFNIKNIKTKRKKIPKENSRPEIHTRTIPAQKHTIHHTVYSDIRKRRLKFYGHIKIIVPGRLAKQIIEFYE